MFGVKINRTTQNIIVNTYAFSKVRYGMVIMWDLISKTRRKKLDSMLRSCTKRIRDCTIQSQNDWFEVVTNYEPLGLKAMQRMVKISQKLKRYYPGEMERFTSIQGGEAYW